MSTDKTTTRTSEQEEEESAVFSKVGRQGPACTLPWGLEVLRGEGSTNRLPRTVYRWEPGRGLVRPLSHVSRARVVERGSLAILSACFYLFFVFFSHIQLIVFMSTSHATNDDENAKSKNEDEGGERVRWTAVME